MLSVSYFARSHYRGGSTPPLPQENHLGLLGSVDVHRRRMMVAAMAMKAAKLVSVLQQRVVIPLYSLIFPKRFSIRWRHL